MVFDEYGLSISMLFGGEEFSCIGSHITTRCRSVGV